MPNFDVVASINASSLSDLIGQYFNSSGAAVSTSNPFSSSITTDVGSLRNVTVTWMVKAAPSITFGAPSATDWAASLDSKGSTNGADGNPVPSGTMLIVTIPDISASYVSPGVAPVSGEAQNVVAYVALDFPAGVIAMTMVGLSIDETDFKPWDKAVFNLVLVPAIFSAVTSMVSVVHIPTLSWQGVTLNPVQINLVEDQLLAAATLSGNAAPLDLTDCSWPTDPIFVVASEALLNAALASGVAPYQGKSKTDSGDFKGLATWDYSASLASIAATLSTVSPLTVTAAVGVSATVGGSLTTAGKALAAVGCAVGAAALAL